MAGLGEYSGYNRPFGLDPNRETNDLYDTRYQQIYGYHTPVTEEFQGPPLVMDDLPEEGMKSQSYNADKLSLNLANKQTHNFCQIN